MWSNSGIVTISSVSPNARFMCPLKFDLVVEACNTCGYHTNNVCYKRILLTALGVGKGGGGANGPHNIYARGAWPPQNNMFAHVHRHMHVSSAQA